GQARGPGRRPGGGEGAGGGGEGADQGVPAGPWGGSQPAGNGEPFLPSRPPVELGSSPSGDGEPGPWGPHRKKPALSCPSAECNRPLVRAHAQLVPFNPGPPPKRASDGT